MGQQRFAGKVALITGSARGIGRGIAWRLAEEGADIILNDLPTSAELSATAEEIRHLGRQVIVCPADVSERDAVAGLFDQAVAHYGQIDIVVANAGFSIREPTVTAEWANVEKTIGITQFGVYHTCQMAAKQMVRQVEARQLDPGGKILIIGSIMGEMPIPTSAPYNMAKAAVNHFGKTLAAELTPYRINVNIINPGWIDTPGERKFATEEQIREDAKKIPWGRIGMPEDIAKAAAFLVSDEADYITGSALRVDGGYKLGLRLT